MALPKIANATIDIYRPGRAPPQTPDVAGVPCWIQGDYWSALKHADDSDPTTFKYTHVLYVDLNTDIRDAYQLGSVVTVGAVIKQDRVWMPNQNGTGFIVQFVERLYRGQPADCKKAYIARLPSTPWPTNNV